MINRFSFGLILWALASPAVGLDLIDYDLVDLTHPYNSETLYWPTSPSRFDKEKLSFGKTDSGYFYSSFSICTPEHGGTHLDAPLHFAEDGYATNEVPLRNLIAPAVVLDVSGKAAADRNYLLNADDIRAFEEQHGRIESGSMVLLRTDWSHYWPDAKNYLGDDMPGDASNLEFPSFGEEAARLLVEKRGVTVLGVDTASTDFGRSQDFIVHRIAASRQVSNLENLTNLDKLPPTGSIVMALPMKIEGGSGGPVRVVALIRKEP